MEDLEDLENFGMENLKDRLTVINNNIYIINSVIKKKHCHYRIYIYTHTV